MNDDQDQFRFLRSVFYSQLKSKVGNILAKATALRIRPLHRWRAYSFTRTRSPLPLTNLSLPISFPLLRYPLPPLHLVCARLPPPASALSLSPHRRSSISSYGPHVLFSSQHPRHFGRYCILLTRFTFSACRSISRENKPFPHRRNTCRC